MECSWYKKDGHTSCADIISILTENALIDGKSVACNIPHLYTIIAKAQQSLKSRETDKFLNLR